MEVRIHGVDRDNGKQHYNNHQHQKSILAYSIFMDTKHNLQPKAKVREVLGPRACYPSTCNIKSRKTLTIGSAVT